MILLDNNATTPIAPEVASAIAAYVGDPAIQGNPSSSHRVGQAARTWLHSVRERVAAATGAEPAGVTFTSGGTEADNLAVLGLARARRSRGQSWGLLTSPLEHPAVRQAADRLKGEGAKVVDVPVDGQGRIDAHDVERLVAEHEELGVVSLAAANHELGNAYPIAEFAAAARRAGPDVVVHTDAVQAWGKLEVSLKAWGVDAISISAHKVYGPKGVGALIHKPLLPMAARTLGGSQEQGRRTGTQPTLALAGLGAAAELVLARRAEWQVHLRALREALLAAVTAVPGARVLGDPEHCTGNTVCAMFEGCDTGVLLMNLDLRGFAVSAGAACSSGGATVSAIVAALSPDPTWGTGGLRISLGSHNTAQDVAAFRAALAEAVTEVRAAGSVFA